MKASVIREMSLNEIRERIDTEKSAYHKLKMNHVVSSLENPVKLKYNRRAIARLSTELTKRESEETVGGSATTAKKTGDTTPVEEKVKETADTVKAEETEDNVPADQASTQD